VIGDQPPLMKASQLEQQWQDLMLLCRKEEEFAESRTHPKLLKLVRAQIVVAARELGFSARQIVTREFRAERQGGRIVRVITD
jgi:citrate lyase beta subunit